MSKKRALKHPSEMGPVFWTFSGPTIVNVGLTLLDIFFYLFRHDWPIKVTKWRLEYAYSNYQIWTNFVSLDITSIEYKLVIYIIFMWSCFDMMLLWRNFQLFSRKSNIIGTFHQKKKKWVIFCLLLSSKGYVHATK